MILIQDNLKNNFSDNDFKKLILRFFSFWPFFLFSLLIFLLLSFLFLRYTNNLYSTKAIIEILDKAQDSEMALPTEMTVFNRSMINLENEIGRLSSFNLNSEVVSKLNSNVTFYTHGKIKKTQNHISEFFDDFKIEYKINTDTIKQFNKFIIYVDNKSMKIDSYDMFDDLYMSYDFGSLTTVNNIHKLPFDLTINDKLSDKSFVKEIVFAPFSNSVDYFLEKIKLNQTNNINSGYSNGSDQISITLNLSNKKISEEYISTLISEFDLDGINDRRLEYKRTIEFVDDRSLFLEKELNLIESKKQDFKKINKLTDIKADANFTITQQYNYDAELFESQSQKDLLGLLESELSQTNFKLLPVNIGLGDPSLNEIITRYNILINDRNRLMASGVGLNNSSIKKIETQLNELYSNVIISIENYGKSLDVNISKIINKEEEFEKFYQNIPKNEKILRSIERELEVKEALYLLLLQKKEEASINFAVVKPTIKLIDSPRSSSDPIYPNKFFVYIFALANGFLIPLGGLSIWFYLDNKIHTKDQLMKKINLPILAEIPHLNNDDFKKVDFNFDNDRSILTESMRMMKANLDFILKTAKKSVSKGANTILITSSIKGEGKTLVSTNFANVLSSSNKKVLLVGADLRNPQIHKFFKIKRESLKGITDFLMNKEMGLEKIIKRFGNLDVIFSGSIPPNPSKIIESDSFEKLFKKLNEKYDYIVIDSAPCLLVADTLSIARFADTSIFVVRANYTKSDVLDFIKELKQDTKIRDLNLILNGVGNSRSYGYSYSYSYGYKYSYNYGYGYGYKKDD